MGKCDMNGGCLHDIFEDGPRVPLAYGSAPTDVCVMCGAWRTTHHILGRWQLAETLEAALIEDGER